MPDVSNATFDNEFNCRNQSIPGLFTYSSPCNWNNYPTAPDGLPKDVVGFVRYMWDRSETIISDTQQTGGLLAGIAAVVFNSFLAVVALITWGHAAIVHTMGKVWPNRADCDTDDHRNANAILQSIDGFTKWFFGVPDSLIARLQKRVNYTCPTEIIGPGELNAARIRGFIDKDQWEFGQKLNDQLPDWQERAYLASQTVFTVPEVMRLWCTGVIRTNDIPNWCRANGVISQQVVDGYKYLYEITPNFGQCLGAMVHNTEDAATDKLFGLSSDFDERQTPAIKLWLRKSGYTEEMQRFLWKQNRQLISYRMIGQLYATGQITLEDLPVAFKAMGFTSKISDWLTGMVKDSTRAKRAALAGKPTLAELETWFITGLIDEAGYRAKLGEQEVGVDVQANLIDTAKTRRKALAVKYTLTWLQRAFIAGRVDFDDAVSTLTAAGLTDAESRQVIGRWDRKRYYGDKSLAISENCKLVASGHMDMPEYMKRASNLGFNPVDAALKAQMCNEVIAKERARDAEKQQAAALREATKADKKAKAAAKAEAEKYRLQFPCKPKPKPSCPAGVDLPEKVKEILAGANSG